MVMNGYDPNLEGDNDLCSINGLPGYSRPTRSS
jgi:hypothetical protein